MARRKTKVANNSVGITVFLRLPFFLFFLCIDCVSGFAQNIFDARQSVILQATAVEDPPSIILSWVLDTANGGYSIWRKGKDDDSWIDSLTYLDAGSTTWTDTTVYVGIGYEYQVLKSLPAFPTGEGGDNTGAGYIFSGIRLPPMHHRGTCLVVIDSTFKQTLALEITRLLDDIMADGWQVQALYVDRNDRVPDVKALIKSWSGKHHDIHQAVFLLGRVPVPYAGEIAPDGHHSDHKGAWPSDGYYANLDGLWTDQTVNTTAAVGSRNDNVPGDGKFDNSKFPSRSQLQIGRVDFANMTKFPETEEQLLQRYLDKDHAWRTGKMTVMERGLVDNNFPASQEGLGQSGWKNFAAMFGISNVKDLQYRQTLTNESYLWSYGCGGGGPESASDISSTTNFTTDSLQTVFTMLFGSYFGDWDYPNDFLRGAIASRSCLASTWGNRPNWLFQHMALGEHIGYSVEVTINNNGLYIPAYYSDFVHTALMGDPTLRMHVHQPVENIIANQSGLHVQLDWHDPAISTGYFIYKKTLMDTAYQLLNHVPITTTTYIDTCAGEGMIYYMVRSIELKTSGSGTYFNLSSGVSVSILSEPTPFYAEAEISSADPGQSNGSVTILPQGGCAPYSYAWDTGHTTSSIQDLAPGVYCVTITECMGCTQSYCATVELSSSVSMMPGLITSKLYPNPTGEQFFLELEFDMIHELSLDILDAKGMKIAHQHHLGKNIQLSWDIHSLPSGFYILRIESAQGYMTIPFTKVTD